MADTEDPIQQAADAAIKKWADSVRFGPSPIDGGPPARAERRRSLLVRFNCGGRCCAVYHKPTNQPQLILKRRTQTDDYVILARTWQAANDKAREQGWIV